MVEMTDFQCFIKTNKLKQKQVADYLGTSPQYISQVKKGVSALSDDKYELLAKSGWDVSMLKFPSYIKVPAATMKPAEDTTPIPDQHQALAQAMNDGHFIITDAESINMKEIPVEIVEEIKEEFREEIREEVIAEITKTESVPYVPSSVANNIHVEDIREYLEKKGDELERIKPGDLVGDAESAERVRKTSMSPTFIPGDIVFVQFLDNIKNITDGQIYYFKMATRPTMIRRVKIEGDYLRLVADNPNFGDIITSFNEIVNVADIVGMFRTSFGNQYAEIEALRAKKEKQIDNLIDEIRDSGKRTDRVMEQSFELMQKLMEKLK